MKFSVRVPCVVRGMCDFCCFKGDLSAFGEVIRTFAKIPDPTKFC